MQERKTKFVKLSHNERAVRTLFYIQRAPNGVNSLKIYIYI